MESTACLQVSAARNQSILVSASLGTKPCESGTQRAPNMAFVSLEWGARDLSWGGRRRREGWSPGLGSWTPGLGSWTRCSVDCPVSFLLTDFSFRLSSSLPPLSPSLHQDGSSPLGSLRRQSPALVPHQAGQHWGAGGRREGPANHCPDDIKDEGASTKGEVSLELSQGR